MNFIGASTRTDIDEAFDYLVPTLATALSSYRTKKIWREYTETYLRIQCAHKCMDTKENYYWPEQVVIMRRFAVEELIRSGGGLIDEDTLGANKKWNHSATAGGMNFAANAPNAKHNVAGGHHNALGAAELVDKACAAASKPFDGGIGARPPSPLRACLPTDHSYATPTIACSFARSSSRYEHAIIVFCVPRMLTHACVGHTCTLQGRLSPTSCSGSSPRS